MAALISSVMDTKDKVPFFVNQAESMGIEILPPDVNLSDHEFVVVDGQHPLRARRREGRRLRRRRGDQARAREDGGPFTSLWDFCERVDGRTVNKKAIEALIKCGAFGSTGATRKGMLDVLEAAQAAGQKAQLDAQIGQGSIFDLGGFGGDGAAPRRSPRPAHPPIPTEEFDRPRAAGDREGVDRPLHHRAPAQARARGAAREGRHALRRGDASARDGEWVKVGGMIAACKKIKTRSGVDGDVRHARRPRRRRSSCSCSRR